jgi:hypothetical protein
MAGEIIEFPNARSSASSSTGGGHKQASAPAREPRRTASGASRPFQTGVAKAGFSPEPPPAQRAGTKRQSLSTTAETTAKPSVVSIFVAKMMPSAVPEERRRMGTLPTPLSATA